MENAWQHFLRQLGSADLEFTYDEVCGWSAEEFEALSGGGLIGETAWSTHVTCDACSEAHWERVRFSEDGKRPFIPCPVAGTVAVDLQRLRLWRIDLGRLAVLLAEALDVRLETQPLATIGLLWHLGRRRFGGAFRDFLFCVSPDEELPAAIKEAQQLLPSGTGLLIVPSAARADSGWEPSRLKVVGFSDVATWEGGKIVLDLGLIDDIFLQHGAGVTKSGVRSLSVPDGALWTDVLIELADTETHNRDWRTKKRAHLSRRWIRETGSAARNAQASCGWLRQTGVRSTFKSASENTDEESLQLAKAAFAGADPD